MIPIKQYLPLCVICFLYFLLFAFIQECDVVTASEFWTSAMLFRQFLGNSAADNTLSGLLYKNIANVKRVIKY